MHKSRSNQFGGDNELKEPDTDKKPDIDKEPYIEHMQQYIGDDGKYDLEAIKTSDEY